MEGTVKEAEAFHHQGKQISKLLCMFTKQGGWF